MGMGGFKMITVSTTAGKNPLEKNGVALIVNKRVWNAVFGCNLKNDRMIFILQMMILRDKKALTTFTKVKYVLLLQKQLI